MITVAEFAVGTLLYRNGKVEPLELMEKDSVADILLERLVALYRDKNA